MEAVYALIYGLTELAATMAPEDYQAALSSAKVLVKGNVVQPVVACTGQFGAAFP